MSVISTDLIRSNWRWRYAWLGWVLASLLPLWSVGMFERDFWTPDEPREADIVWRMSAQPLQALPQLADRTFLEKPPLSYWMGALSLRVFGNNAAAMRVPNFIYALIVTIAVATLAFAMAGREAALVAALLAGSMFQLLRVQIWLAPDAGLLAGCAIALLGLYRGYVATDRAAKFGWYTLMHAGALVAFMAKSAVGWMVPGLALLTLTLWERRWSEWLNWRLWFGAIVQLVVIGAWVTAVWRRQDGADDLRMLFWNNLAGRFTHIANGAAPNYAGAHVNWPGKYLVELPYYLFPWTLLLIAALQRAWRAVRGVTELGTAWRFAISSWLPLAVVLSSAATARDVYFAPALLGICITIALWSRDVAVHRSATSVWCIRGTRYLSAVLLLVVAVACTVLMASHSMEWGMATSRFIGIGVAAALVVLAWWMLRYTALAQRAAHDRKVMVCCYGVTVLALSIGLAVVAPIANRWQDLGSIARAVQRDTGDAALALVVPDETTVAIMDYYTHRPVTLLDGEAGAAPQLLDTWFKQHGAASRALILLPGHGSGPLSRWLQGRQRKHRAREGVLTEMETTHFARVVAHYDLPQGRRYALLAPAASAVGKP